MESLCNITKNNMCYIGIDPSITNTGIVVLDSDGKLIKAADCKLAFKNKKFDSDIQRYMGIANYVVSNFPLDKELLIGYENYSFNSVHRGYSLAEYGGILKSTILRLFPKTTITLIAPTANKKFATGSGNATKNMMVKQANSESAELQTISDDICDAFFLAKFTFYMAQPELAAQQDLGIPHLRQRLEMCLNRGDK